MVFQNLSQIQDAREISEISKRESLKLGLITKEGKKNENSRIYRNAAAER